MKYTTVPASRFGWQGDTLDYVVKAEGATEVSVPEEEVKGLEVRITDTRKVGNGVEAHVSVSVKDPLFY